MKATDFVEAVIEAKISEYGDILDTRAAYEKAVARWREACAVCENADSAAASAREELVYAAENAEKTRERYRAALLLQPD